MAEEQSRNRRPLVLVPCPLQGHIIPMFQLATILHSQGFPTVIAPPHPKFNFPDSSNHPDFTFHPLTDIEIEASDDIIATLSYIERKCAAPLQDLLTQIIEKQAKLREDLPCVVYDDVMYFAESVANKLKLPSITLDVTSIANMYTNFAYPRLVEEGHLPARESQSSELVPGLHPLRFKDLLVSDFKDLDATMQFLSKITKPIRSSSAAIWNSMNCLENSSLYELQQQFQVPLFAVGPLHKMAPTTSFNFLQDNNSCITWLNKQNDKSVLYVSFGSLASVNEKELVEMAWGLANSKQPFLWVIRPGLVYGSETEDPLLSNDFLQNVGERGCIVKWAPQKEVLAHKAIGGFWTQCGWNSTVEGICEGIPMMCTPFLLDQRVNARYASHIWGVGLELDRGFERGDVEKAIKQLMVDKEGEMLRQRVAELKAEAEISVREGGSSCDSIRKLVELIMTI